MLHLKGQKVKIVCPPAPRSEDGSAGGGLGEECRAVRALEVPHRPNTWRAEPSRNFPFLFRIFFRGRAQKKNCKGKFLRGCRRSDSGGGWGESVRFSSELPRAPRVRQSGFCSKKVRISTKRYRNKIK